jgi:hypothetical protein
VGESLPRRALRLELLSTRCGELVIARAAIVLRRSPVRRDPPASFEPAESRVERTVIDVEDSAGDRLDGLGQLPAISGTAAEELEDNEVERALQQVDLARRSGQEAPLENQ